MNVSSDVSLCHVGIGPVIDLCLKWDPKNRKTATELLSDPYFLGCSAACQNLLRARISTFKDPYHTAKKNPLNEPYRKQSFDRRFNANFEKARLAVSQAPILKAKKVMRSFPTSPVMENLYQNEFLQTSSWQSILKKQKSNHSTRTASLSPLPVQMPIYKTLGSISNDSINFHPNKCNYLKSFSSLSSVEGKSGKSDSQVLGAFGKANTSSSIASDSMKKGNSQISHFINLNLNSEFELDQYYTSKAVLKDNNTKFRNTSNEETSLIFKSFQTVDEKLELEDNTKVSLSSLDRALERVDNIIQNFTTPSSHISKVGFSKNDGSKFECGIFSDPTVAVSPAIQRAEAAQELRKYQLALNRLNSQLNSR
jgi:hypothetical protein